MTTIDNLEPVVQIKKAAPNSRVQVKTDIETPLGPLDEVTLEIDGDSEEKLILQTATLDAKEAKEEVKAAEEKKKIAEEQIKEVEKEVKKAKEETENMEAVKEVIKTKIAEADTPQEKARQEIELSKAQKKKAIAEASSGCRGSNGGDQRKDH